MQVNMYEAKTQLTKLVKQLPEKKEIVIARNGKPVAKLVPYSEKDKRTFGVLKGKFKAPKDLDESNDMIAEMFGVSK